jgi:hypothetical protein
VNAAVEFELVSSYFCGPAGKLDDLSGNTASTVTGQLICPLHREL